tara:strand:- start:754 stop:939 length:186 start_codon:yes stop_codon:yes gene_type:complete
MLSRKYYRMIARVIKHTTINNNDKMLPTINKALLVSELCNELHCDNSYFDSSKFIEACGDE